MRGRWIVPCALLAACTTNVKDSRQNEVTFTCEGGVQITAWFEDRGVRLLLPGSTEKLRLPQVRSTTGDRYEEGDVLFRVHTDSATLERNGERVYHGCAP